MSLIDLSELRFFLKAVSINAGKVVDTLVDRYNQLLQLKPEQARDVYFEIGRDLEKKGDRPGAIKAYKKVLAELKPDDTEVLFRLGRTYLESGMAREASEVFERFTVIESSSPIAWYLLGVACFSIEEPAKAEGAFKEAIRLDSGYAEAYYKLGLIYDGRADFDKAIEMYQKTIALKPDFVKAYQSIGLTYEGKGMREEAVKYFKKSIELDEKKLQYK